jgi:hypothetical protein
MMGSLSRFQRQVMAPNEGSLMMEAMEPMLLVGFLKPGWFSMAEAKVTLVMVRSSCCNKRKGSSFFLKNNNYETTLIKSVIKQVFLRRKCEPAPIHLLLHIATSRQSRSCLPNFSFRDAKK